jgi:predicted metalloenzyme YecM
VRGLVILLLSDLPTLTDADSEAYAPNLDINQYPPVVQVKSVHNTPIEGLWHWLSETCGLNMKDTIINGQTLGIYHSESPVHKCVIFLTFLSSKT